MGERGVSIGKQNNSGWAERERQKEKEGERDRDRQTDRQIDRQTYKKTDRSIHHAWMDGEIDIREHSAPGKRVQSEKN